MTDGCPTGFDAPERLAPVLERPVRWDRPFFSDRGMQERLRRSGFAIGPTVLDAASRAALEDLAATALARVGGDDGLFLTVGRIADASVRNELIAATASVVLPELHRFFLDDVELLGSALQIKPPSDRSELNPHQDSSLVDERQWPSAYAWIPLTDTSVRNGGLFVLPGSHRFGNRQRTLNVDWQLQEYSEPMRARGVPLEVEAGRVVFFDAATVHWSPPNESDRRRVAVNSFAKPAAAPLLHFFADHATAPDHVEAYEIDVDFFLHEQIMERPAQRHRRLGPTAQVKIEWDADTFVRLCDQAIEEADLPGD